MPIPDGGCILRERLLIGFEPKLALTASLSGGAEFSLAMKLSKSRSSVGAFSNFIDAVDSLVRAVTALRIAAHEWGLLSETAARKGIAILYHFTSPPAITNFRTILFIVITVLPKLGFLHTRQVNPRYVVAPMAQQLSHLTSRFQLR